MRLHIAYMLPPRVHGFRGFQEVIETLRWGLAALGHEVSAEANMLVRNAVNIIFGAHVLKQTDIDALPANTIIYNLEQMASVACEDLGPISRAVARRFRIWDYSPRNLETWRMLGAVHEPVLVPVGWAPILARIPKRAHEDIDVLFYGIPSEGRFQILHQVGMSGMSCLYACGMYGAARDELIARSKIVLNINMYTTSKIFEVVRVSYLLANGKAVVADSHPETFIEPDLLRAVAFVPPERVCGTCRQLLENEPARRELEKRGQEIIQQRDIRAILRNALAASGIH
jgi:hypothetical protein